MILLPLLNLRRTNRCLHWMHQRGLRKVRALSLNFHRKSRQGNRRDQLRDRLTLQQIVEADLRPDRAIQIFPDPKIEAGLPWVAIWEQNPEADLLAHHMQMLESLVALDHPFLSLPSTLVDLNPRSPDLLRRGGRSRLVERFLQWHLHPSFMMRTCASRAFWAELPPLSELQSIQARRSLLEVGLRLLQLM